MMTHDDAHVVPALGTAQTQNSAGTGSMLTELLLQRLGRAAIGMGVVEEP